MNNTNAKAAVARRSGRAMATKKAGQSIRNNLASATSKNAEMVKWFISELRMLTTMTEQGVIVSLLMSGLKDQDSIFSRYIPDLKEKWEKRSGAEPENL